MTNNGNGAKPADRRTVSTDRRDRMGALAEQIGKRAADAPKLPTAVQFTPHGWICRVGPYRSKAEAVEAKGWIDQAFYDIAHLLVCVRDGISKPANINGTMSGNIRELRQARGWSQCDLGARVSVSGNVIQMIEAGRKAPTLDTAVALSQALGVSVSEMIGQSTEKGKA